MGDTRRDDWAEWWRRHGERELRCILMTAWDPIGVRHAPNAWDEYDGYALQVARRLRETPDPERARETIAAYLDRSETKSMGLGSGGRAGFNQDLAEALVAWHEWSYRQGGRPRSDGLDD